jgi:hypothetical protein
MRPRAFRWLRRSAPDSQLHKNNRLQVADQWRTAELLWSIAENGRAKDRRFHQRRAHPRVFRYDCRMGRRQGSCVWNARKSGAVARTQHDNLRPAKADAYWDPLRGYPKFEKIVNSLASK